MSQTTILLGTDGIPVSTGAGPADAGTIRTVPATGAALGAVDQGAPAPASDRWPVQLTDGTDLALVTAAGALEVDGSAVTQPVSIAATVAVAPTAGTLRVGGTYDVGGNVIDEVPTVRSINRAFVNATASGNTEVVASQGASVRVRVLSVFCVTSTAVSVKFQSATTDISATFPIAATGGFVMPETQHGWFQTAANEALNVNLSGAATNCGVSIIWVQAT